MERRAETRYDDWDPEELRCSAPEVLFSEISLMGEAVSTVECEVGDIGESSGETVRCGRCERPPEVYSLMGGARPNIKNARKMKLLSLPTPYKRKKNSPGSSHATVSAKSVFLGSGDGSSGRLGACIMSRK